MNECPDCYGSGVHDGELCPLCNGNSGFDPARTVARQRAIKSYLIECDRLIIEGDVLYGVTMYRSGRFEQLVKAIDSDGAMAYWLDAMKALDAAIEVRKGIENDPWRGTVFGHE